MSSEELRGLHYEKIPRAAVVNQKKNGKFPPVITMLFAFVIFSLTVTISNALRVENPIPPLKLRRCGFLRYKIPAGTFVDEIDGDTRNLQLSLRNSTGGELNDNDWIAFDAVNQTLFAVLNDNELRSASVPSVHRFQLIAKTKRGKSAFNTIELVLSEAWHNTSVALLVNFLWMTGQKPPLAIMLTTFAEKMMTYLGESAENIRFTHLAQVGMVYTTGITNCTAHSDRCSLEGIKKAKSMLYTELGTVLAFRNTMLPEFYVSYTQISKAAECQPPEAPRVMKSFPPITLTPCTTINQSIPYDVFHDEEDGYNLQLVIHAIDGRVPKNETLWLGINEGNNMLYGVVTEQAIKDQPRNGYNLTIRAYDSQFLWAEAHLILTITHRPLQKYYQFTLHLTAIGNAILSPIFQQTIVARIINNYFKANFTNLLSYTKVSNRELRVSSSICTLPLKCDASSFNSIWSKMATTEGTPRAEFKSAFAQLYMLQSVTQFVDPICLQALDPPVPMMNPWTVPISSCGGFNIQVPAGLFFDKQDGDLRSLSLALYLNDKKVSTSGWLQLNSTSQVLYGLPTHEDISEYQKSGSQQYKLVATDRSGMNGSLELKLSTQPIKSSTYRYMIVYSQVGFSNTLDELLTFSKKLNKYLGNGLHMSIGLEKVEYLSSETRRIYYTNCSLYFDPCDTYLVNQINSRLFVPSLSAEFKSEMEPDFKIRIMSATNSTTSCHANTPPRILQPIPLIQISVCGLLKFPIPVATFYDNEDGKAPNLTLSLSDSNNSSLSMGSWVNWNSEKQVITFVGTVSRAKSQGQETFLLTASDKGGLSTQLSIYTSISGPLNVLSECQIRTKFHIDQSLSAHSNAYLTEMILSKMATYFGLNSQSQIALVSVQRESSTSITISWSYCAAHFVHYTQSSTSYQSIRNLPDFNSLSLLLRKVFVPGTFYLHSEFKEAFQGFSINSAIRIFSGACSSFPPVIGLNKSHFIINASNSGVTKILVGKEWFYDVEDGNAHQLNLKFMNHLHAEITDLESWIGFDKTSKMILIAISDKERHIGLSTANFYLRATDSTAKFIELSIRVNIIQEITRIPHYNIALFFVNKIKVSYQTDTAFIAEKISSAYSLSGVAEILFHSFHQDKGYIDSSVFTWSSNQHTTCSSAILQKARSQQTSEVAFSALKEKFLPKFELQRVVIRSSCSGSNTPPQTQISSIQFNVNMCGVFVYKIPHSTFSDAVDGNTKNIAVTLLDSQKRNVSDSSWIQLNAATLQLYAIMSLGSSLHPGTSRFYLQAVNSRSLSTEVELNVKISEQPHTNDCPITIVVKQKIGPEHMVDLSVLNRLLEAIRDYYRDKEIKIKVLEFRKLSAYVYSLKYSNCSFTFPTKDAARKGYDASFQTTINEVFYRLVKPDGSIQLAFSSFLSTLFEVTSVMISYECIEAPPYATVSQVRSFASTCKEFRKTHSKTMFSDARDGSNLKYSLTYPSGRPLSPNEWIAFNEKTMEVYGMVTEDVKRKAPSLGYNYLIVATDSSGRSANITYLITIATPLPYMPIKTILAYNSTMNDTTTTADSLVEISRKIAGYLDGASRADEIMINSVNPGKSITFSHCKLSCTEADYMKISSRFQKLAFTSEPSHQFKLASGGSFTPERVYLNGSSCLPSKQITIVVRKVVVFSLQKVCGFVEYEIPDDVFADNSGRKTKDFIVDMDQFGKSLSSIATAFEFDKGYHLFYGPVVTSQISSQTIYNLQARHPQSGLTGSTSFILNNTDFHTFDKISKSLCVVSATVTTTINPAYSDAYVIKKFMKSVAAYLGLTLQEMQIISFARKEQNPLTFVVSFANCHWYGWISANSPIEMTARYTKSRDDTMKAIFANTQQQTAFNAAFSRALNPDFSLRSLSVNDWCTKAPNKRPIVNKYVITITTRPCTGFFYQVPDNTFSDEDGNARNLKLQLFNADGSSLTASDWISFNTATQSIYGSPTKQAHETNSGFHNYTLRATDQYGLTATTTVSIKISGSAAGNEAPTINMNNFKIVLPLCGIYRATLPENFATDKEDGSMKNLRVDLKMADGSKIPRDSWIQFDYSTHEIYSLVPERISKTSVLEWQYRVIVTDSCGGVATATIKVTTQKSSAFYYGHTFKFQSMLGNTLPYLNIQIKFLELVSKYFNEISSNFRTLSFSKLAGTETYEYSFANCSTNEYVCPVESSLYLSTQSLFTESTKSMNSFATYLSRSFSIVSYVNQTSYQADSPPRNISSLSSEIEATSCGGYYQDISKYFTDEGSLRYEISFENGSAIPKSFPFYLTSNMLKITRLGPESSGVYAIRLTAYDNCNQTSYKDLKIRIDNPASHSGYQIRFEGEVKADISTVHYISEFQTALQRHLRHPQYVIEVESYVHQKTNLVFTWKSCYEMKCNKTDMAYLHSQLFTANNVTNPAFLQRLRETFSNPKLTEYRHHCNFTSHEPPRSNGSLEIVTEICRKVDFRVPATIFSDKEDGNARNMHLSLLTENTAQLANNHWLQFNRLTQTIYGYPRFSSSATFKRSYVYRLVASDIQGNTAWTPVSVQIRGSTEVTYRLTMHGEVKFDHHGPNVDFELILVRKIGIFFNDAYINDISFTRSASSFAFSWSYCRMTTAKCDCLYIRQIESLLSKINELKHAMRPEFEVINVTSTKYGVCINQNPPQVLNDTKELYITGGQVFSYKIHNRHFYDLEDGYTRNLTLYIADNNNKSVTASHWMKLNEQHICGLVTLSQLESSEWASSSSSSSTYKLVARDACGKEVHDSFSAVVNPYRASFNYKINVYVSNNYSEIASNCTKMQRFTYLVSSYINVSNSDVFIYNIQANVTTRNETSSSSNYTVIVWGLRNYTEKNCTNGTIRIYGEKFSYENGSINRAFYNHMRSDFNVVKVQTNTSACSNGTFVPLALPVTASDFVFPFWILILLAIIAILFMLCWLCWICIPRLCPGCSVGCIQKDLGCCSSLCGKCCMPGGKYASMEKAALAPDVEEGVLSNARTAPESTLEKAGKEVSPDDVEIAAAAEEDQAPSTIDEEEMKMGPDAAPALYANPDIKFTAPDYVEEDKAPINGLSDSFEEAAPSSNEMNPGAAPVLPIAPYYRVENRVLSNDADDSYEEPATDISELGTSAAPFPDEVINGVASMPHEQAQDSEMSGYPQSEEYSSVASSQYDIEGGALSAPFANDLHGYDYQRSSYSESSYSRFDDEAKIPQSVNELPMSQELAPSFRSMPSGGKKLSLPQMPNVFSDNESMSRSSRETRTSIVTNDRDSFERRVSSVDSQYLSKEQNGRRVTMTKPVVLVVPRNSVASLMDADDHEMNNHNISRKRSKRRRSSQFALLDHEEYDDRANVSGRRKSQTRRTSHVSLQRSGDIPIQGKRISRVRLLSSEGSLASGVPIELNMINDNFSHGAQEYNDRRVSRVSNVSFRSLRDQDIFDSAYHQPNARASGVRKFSVPSQHSQAVEYDTYGQDRRGHTARRASLSPRRDSASQKPHVLIVDSNNVYRRAAQSNTGDLMGYESDSTDSGYVMRRNSRRYRQRIYQKGGHLSDARDSYGGHLSDARDSYGGHLSDPRDTFGGHLSDGKDGYGGHLSDARDSYGGHLSDARASYGGHLSDARDSYGGHLGDARDSYGGHLSDARDSYGGHLSDARDSYGGHLSDARDSYGGHLGDARDSYGGHLSDARDSYGGRLSDARDKYGGEKERMRKIGVAKKMSTGAKSGNASQEKFFEMWSRDQVNRVRNHGYEDDSFV